MAKSAEDKKQFRTTTSASFAQKNFGECGYLDQEKNLGFVAQDLLHLNYP